MHGQYRGIQSNGIGQRSLCKGFKNNTVHFHGQDFQFIHFGIGRKGCPGLTFVVFSVEYVMANLLYWFDWKLPGNISPATPQKLDMEEVFGLIVHKKNHLLLVPIPSLIFFFFFFCFSMLFG